MTRAREHAHSHSCHSRVGGNKAKQCTATAVPKKKPHIVCNIINDAIGNIV